MAERPSLHIAVAGQKNKASEYNDNFEMMMDYVEDNVSEMQEFVGDLSTVTNLSQSFKTLLLNALYPIGAVFSSVTNTSTCPIQEQLGGTWQLVASGKALWTGDGTNGGTTISAGLPNATGNVYLNNFGANVSNANGAFTSSGSGTFAVGASYGTGATQTSFNAANSSSVYGQSSTVQPPAFVVNVWKRTA